MPDSLAPARRPTTRNCHRQTLDIGLGRCTTWTEFGSTPPNVNLQALPFAADAHAATNGTSASKPRGPRQMLSSPAAGRPPRRPQNALRCLHLDQAALSAAPPTGSPRHGGPQAQPGPAEARPEPCSPPPGARARVTGSRHTASGPWRYATSTGTLHAELPS